jgi:hypothetical protein
MHLKKTNCELNNLTRQMKYTVFLTAFLISCSTTTKNTNGQQENIDNDLVSQESFKYEKDSNGRVVKETIELKIFDQSKIVSINQSIKITDFTKNNKIKRIEYYDLIGNIKVLSKLENYEGNTIERLGFSDLDTIQYEKELYDDKKRLIKQIINRKFITGDKIQEININKYNDKGEIERKEVYNFKNELVKFYNYSYTKNADRLTIKNVDNKGDTVEITQKEFQDNQLKREISKILDLSIDSSFYDNGLLIKSISKDLSSETEYIDIYKYDNEKRLIERSHYIKNKK